MLRQEGFWKTSMPVMLSRGFADADRWVRERGTLERALNPCTGWHGSDLLRGCHGWGRAVRGGAGDVSDDLVRGDGFMAGESFSTLLLRLFATSVSLTKTFQARLETWTAVK